MRKFFVVLMLSFFICGIPASASEVVERIVAVVNDEIITDEDIEIAMAPIVAQSRTIYSGPEFDSKLKELRQEFISKLIDDRLVLSEAKRRKVIIKDVEVDDMLADVRNKFPNRAVFLKAIQDQGLTEKKLWIRFRDQLLSQKLVNYEVRAKVSISPGEINEYYKNHQDEFLQGDRVKLQQILIRVSSRSDEDALALAQTLIEKIKTGAAFDELARSYSEGVEAKEGGEMGWIEKGQLMGDIDDQIFKLDAGQVVGPIRTNLGYHLFKVTEKETRTLKPLSEAREGIYEVLFKEKLRQRLEGWIADLKKNAYISIR